MYIVRNSKNWLLKGLYIIMSCVLYVDTSKTFIVDPSAIFHCCLHDMYVYTLLLSQWKLSQQGIKCN